VPTLANVALELAIDDLPIVLHRIIEPWLGHSIYAIQTKMEGTTTVSMPWVETWQEAVEGVEFWLFVAGGVWAFANLYRQRAWITNGIALAFVLFLLSYAHL
jgi:hypothetical protein